MKQHFARRELSSYLGTGTTNMKHPTSIHATWLRPEPSVYSIDDLQRDKKTVWDGVTNPQAVRSIKDMQPGDRVFDLPQWRDIGDCRQSPWWSPVAVDALIRKIQSPLSSIWEFVLHLDFSGHAGRNQTIENVRRLGAGALQGRLSTMLVPEKFVSWLREKYPKAGI